MQVLFDKDGYIKEWIMSDDFGSFGSEQGVVVPTPDNLDVGIFYDEYQLYHLVDGQLVKDETRAVKLEEERQKSAKKLSLDEKLKLFVASLAAEDKPEDGEYEPYFDVENMKFTWKPIFGTE